MPATAAIHFESEIHQTPIDRAAVNRANSKHSTGPRTEAGKQRSSLNALRHGLTARAAVLDSENQADYENHHRPFVDQYKTANPIETQLVQELADTSWRLRRIPILEAAPIRPSPQPRVPSPRSGQHERRELRDAAAILELHKHKGIPWQPSDHGFVFSKEQVERCSERMMRQNEARYVAAERFNSPPLAPAWEF
jgi:hypothetical protein